jgi:hypothetical protein
MSSPYLFSSPGLPKQDAQKLLLLAERYSRALAAQGEWATRATEAVNFREGRQFTPDQMQKLRAAGRPALVYNGIAPISRLIEGYFSENRLDTNYVPGQDSSATEETAEALSMVRKQISQSNYEEHVDTDVILDGLLTGRGFWDLRTSFERNLLGEAKIVAKDPFRTLIDPDADKYDPDTWGFTIDTPSLSLDEIESLYGVDAANLVAPWTMGHTPSSPISLAVIDGSPQPVRGFGQSDGEFSAWFDQLYGLLGDFTDPYRKSVRVLDFQYWISVAGHAFYDLDSGDTKVIPEAWDRDKITKVLEWANNVQGAHVRVIKQRMRRVRWTTIIGDLIVYDQWSRQNHLSTIGFFPYFRWGTTKGAVEDLVDPQRQTNVHRSNLTDIVNRGANSGWSYASDTFTPQQKAQFKRYGAVPGVHVEHVPGKEPPKRLEPGTFPQGLDKMVAEGENQMERISSVNASALGVIDRVQSGAAVRARQQQTAVGIQPYQANYKRSKQILGTHSLDLIQQEYVEQRIVRIVGSDSKLGQIIVNREQTDPTSGITSKLNDLTRGKYAVVVDDVPLSATYADAQQQEMLAILDRIARYPFLLQFFDLIVENSDLPNKDEWKKRAQEMMATQGIGPDAAPQPGAPAGPGSPMPAPQAAGGSAPPPPPSTGQPSNVIPLAR